MAKSKRTTAREWVEKARQVDGLKVGDWLEEPGAVARRLEVVGLLQWYDQRKRDNRWWKRAARWVLSKLTRGRWGVPVNRDPMYHLQMWVAEKYQEAGVAETPEGELEVVR